MTAYKPPSTGNFNRLYNKNFGDITGKTGDRRTYNPEVLFNMAREYFEWCDSEYIEVAESAAYQGEVTQSPVSKNRVFTMTGLRRFLCLTKSTMTDLRKDPAYEHVFDFIDDVIHEQKYQLAANNIINAGMIMRDLGMEKGAEINVVNNGDRNTANVNAEELKEAVSSILGKI